jgi:hypothetical protein
MKAKYFKQIRAKAKYYIVRHSFGLFGDFWGMGLNRDYTILAYNEKHACQRAHKKGIGLDHDIGWETQDDKFANWKVREASKPDNHRFIKYF